MAENNTAAQAASERQYDWRPRPDPTLLTTQQLRETEQSILRTIAEKIGALRELQEQRLDGMDKATILLADRLDNILPDSVHGRDLLRGEFADGDKHLRELLEARIDAIDRATQLLAADVGKQPTEADIKIGNLRELVTAKIGLGGAETQRVHDVLLEKFDRVDAQFVSNDKALTAALAAQEKAAAEQQKSNTLAIDKSEKTTSETIKANDAKTASSIQAQAATIDDIKQRVVRIESTGAGATANQAEARDEGAEDRAKAAEARAIAAEVLAKTAALRTNVTIGIAAIALLVAIVVAFLPHK